MMKEAEGGRWKRSVYRLKLMLHHCTSIHPPSWLSNSICGRTLQIDDTLQSSNIQLSCSTLSIFNTTVLTGWLRYNQYAIKAYSYKL